ncbi:SPFH domain-containing protein [Escherichia coli]|uniref:SPFH/Band 7/PHB domain protein n=1 Tax=Escherichia coli TaxID=562 RepID=A0A8S7B693_ECOLX|nr:SPFH domain-containing protein [Escherichia coli]ELO0576609.1 SPFH/Band 7/PHB domain protein [Escherichia coli O2]EFA7221579.1 SPFH/Band 7/PHB domain protein [Escherichia coli]EFA8785740.1 SPFH/Band 7/PHB domain protein [Escherichia coli]EFE0388568.1 SPFH/Band 7/PHB domain protein [Escherichia coli]EFI0447720.1 SPFH/Band 7/PHB domain protein [Escherichia coli]
MKKGLLAVALAAICTMGIIGYDRVEPGFVGIKVNKVGEDKGIGEVVGVGHQWVGINTELYVFPTFKQMKIYDEPFTFQMSDGTAIGHKIGVTYLVNRDKVTTVFQTYRKGVDDITESDLRQKIADSLNRLASRMTTDSFIDGGKAQLLDNALKDIQKEMSPVGIEVLSLSWVGKPDYPKTVIESINAKVTANQRTLQRQQEVEQRKAEANMLREQANGEADAIRARAQAEADAIRLRGEALRQNPNVMELEAINKWNGQLPQYMTQGANTPFITVK